MEHFQFHHSNPWVVLQLRSQYSFIFIVDWRNDQVVACLGGKLAFSRCQVEATWTSSSLGWQHNLFSQLRCWFRFLVVPPISHYNWCQLFWLLIFWKCLPYLLGWLRKRFVSLSCLTLLFQVILVPKTDQE